MQMADENMSDTMILDAVSQQLHQCTFTTINQKMMIVVKINILSGWLSVSDWTRGARSQYFDFYGQNRLTLLFLVLQIIFNIV